MRGLLLRLSELDPDVSASLRVIEYFDRLLENGASLEALTRASAALGCCTAGLRDSDSGRILRFDRQGHGSPPLQHSVVIEAPIMVDDAAVGHVWLERDAIGPLDEMLVERMAVTAAARWRPFSSERGTDPALVELIIAASTEDEDRVRALRLLGFSPSRKIRTLAVTVGSGDLGAALHQVVSVVLKASNGPGDVARAAQLGMTGTVLVQSDVADLAEVLARAQGSVDPAVGIGLGRRVPVSQAMQSWVSARVAARFATAWRRKSAVVDYDDLGALSTLATIPRDVALANGDVQALAELARTDSGELDIDALLAVTWHGSARQAAVDLHLHHSSVTNRLRHIETALDVSMDDPAGRLRAQVAGILWRLNG